ncbi:MAG: hypothetical protein ACRDWN_10450, partial [Acidimicrobiales bacterium]
MTATPATPTPASPTPASPAAAVGPPERAALLVEALPYIRKFQDAVVVVKYGGNALAGAGGPGS